MRKLLLVAALAIAPGCSKSSDGDPPKPGAKDELPSLTVDQVDKELAAKTIQAVDCNHEEMRKKKGVLPGAILVSGSDEYEASVLPADKGAKLVFYCADPG
jgi:hypothetical protein